MPAPPPDALADRIDLWLVRTDESVENWATCEAVLSADEQARATRLRFEQHRREFLITRYWLRVALGFYLQARPEEIRFAYGPKGKPYLADTRSGRLVFNLSHTEGQSLLGFASTITIGVDIEKQRSMENAKALAERFFTQSERELLSSSPADSRMFFRLWTAKEAYLKATGEGVVGLKKVECGLVPTGSLQLLGDRAFAMTEVDAGNGYAAAVCSSPAASVYLSDPLQSLRSPMPAIFSPLL
jgi:4'-phosphopantetheinyl transferase